VVRSETLAIRRMEGIGLDDTAKTMDTKNLFRWSITHSSSLDLSYVTLDCLNICSISTTFIFFINRTLDMDFMCMPGVEY
jgi:hypothetical protein